VVVDAGQRVLEFDDVACRVPQLLGLVTGVVADQLGKRRERLAGPVAEQTETLAVVVDLHVRHRVAAPSHTHARAR